MPDLRDTPDRPPPVDREPDRPREPAHPEYPGDAVVAAVEDSHAHRRPKDPTDPIVGGVSVPPPIPQRWQL